MTNNNDAKNIEKQRYVSHLSDESYTKFLTSPEAQGVGSFYKNFPDTIGPVKQAWKDAGYRWAEKNDPTAFLEMQSDSIREHWKNFPSVAEREVNEFRRKHGLEPRLAGYRAGREPDASWHRPSNHISNTHPNTYEQAAYEKRRGEIAKTQEFFHSFLNKASNAQIEVFKKVMEDPTIEAIRALLNIPYIPQMIREEREKEGERLNKMSDRELCKEMSERYNITFHECLKERMKHNQNIGPTQ